MERFKLPSGVELGGKMADVFLGDDKSGVSIGDEPVGRLEALMGNIPRLKRAAPGEAGEMLGNAFQSMALQDGFRHLLMTADKVQNPEEYLAEIRRIAHELRDDFAGRMKRASERGMVRRGIDKVLRGVGFEIEEGKVSDDVVLKDLNVLRGVVYWTLRQRAVLYRGALRPVGPLLDNNRLYALYEELARMFLDIGQAYLASRDGLSEPVRAQIEHIFFSICSECLIEDDDCEGGHDLGEIHGRLLHKDMANAHLVKTLYVDKISCVDPEFHARCKTRATTALNRMSGFEVCPVAN